MYTLYTVQKGSNQVRSCRRPSSSLVLLAVEEGLLQQRQQLLAVHVAGVQPQRLARELVRLLEVALTEHTPREVTQHVCIYVCMYVCMNTILYAMSAEL